MSTPNFGLFTRGPLAFEIDGAGNCTNDYDLNMRKIDATLATAGFVPPPTKVLYVDKNRTDSFTPNGSLLKPFKAIMDAINQIAVNADSQSVAYSVDIVGSGTYVETLDLSDTRIFGLTIEGHGNVIVQPPNPLNNQGPAIRCVNNDNLGTTVTGVVFSNLILSAAPTIVLLSTTTNNTTFGSVGINFQGCTFSIGGVVTLLAISATNLSVLSLIDCEIIGSISLTNVNQFNLAGYIGSVQSQGAAHTLVTNNSAPKPSGFLGTLLFAIDTVLQGSISIDAGSTVVGFFSEIARGGTVTVNGLFSNRLGWARGNVTVNNGGTYDTRGGIISGTLTVNAGGSVTGSGTIGAQNATLTAAAPTVQAGQLGLGSTTAATATAGAASLPANPTGFLIVNIGGTVQKIPYYNN